MDKILLRMTPLFLCAFVAGYGTRALGQSIHAASPTGSSSAQFEVASVKKCGPDQRNLNTLLTYPGARIEARGATLEFLLMEAYNLLPAQIVGGPKWIHDIRFDIQAKAPESVALQYLQVGNPKNEPPDAVREMLRSLLSERFNLVLHLQKTQGKVYLLARSADRLRLQPSKDDKAFPWSGGTGGGLPSGDGLQGINESMPDLAFRLSKWLSQPVIDETGLTRSYDFLAVLDSHGSDSGMDLDTSIFESIKQLGLRLNKGTGLVQTLIIERASMPGEN